MENTENQIISNIRSGNIAPIYFLTGEEDYYIDLISDYLEENIIEEEFRGFDQTVCYGRDSLMSNIINSAKQFPVMAQRQLILVKEAQDLPIRNNAWDLLAEYLAAPQPTTVLVFCYRHKNFDKRTKAYKAISSKGIWYEHKRLYENQIPTWIAQFVKQHQYAITEKSAVLIATFMGNNLTQIANELRKLFIILQKGTTINDDIVEKYIGISKEYNIYELQNAIGRRDTVACNTIVNYFADTPKENPLPKILPPLYKYFTDLMIYIQNPSECKVNPFFLKDYAAAAKNYTLAKLASCIGYLYDADRHSKGLESKTSDGEILKETIFKIIH